MSTQNIVEDIIIPEIPKVVDDDRILLFVGLAGYENKGIVSFNVREFIVRDGHVTLRHNEDAINAAEAAARYAAEAADSASDARTTAENVREDILRRVQELLDEYITEVDSLIGGTL